jgi:hypothetical protein
LKRESGETAKPKRPAKDLAVTLRQVAVPLHPDVHRWNVLLWDRRLCSAVENILHAALLYRS